MAVIAFGVLASGCAQTTRAPDSQVANVAENCPLAGTWRFEFDSTAQQLQDAYDVLSPPAWLTRPGEDPAYPMEVLSLLANYRSMVDWEWTLDCDRQRLTGPVLGSVEVINDSPYSIEDSADGVLSVSSVDGDGDQSQWFVELLDNDCFEWYSSPDEHRVVWCRAE